MHQRKPCKAFRIVPFQVFLCILRHRNCIHLHMPHRHQCSFENFYYSFFIKFNCVLQFRCCPAFSFRCCPIIVFILLVLHTFLSSSFSFAHLSFFVSTRSFRI